METREILERPATPERPDGPKDQEQRARRGRATTRGLLIAALASFTLPFLTVTCYGDDVTISGVQAATTVDLTPQAVPDPGDEQFADEGEPPNIFAIVALVAAGAAAALSWSRKPNRRPIAVVSATGVAALPGLWFYALTRSSGHAYADIGLALAIALLTAAAWSAIGEVPRWVGAVGLGVGAAMIASTLGGADAVEDVPILFLAFWIGTVVATCLAMGAALGVGAATTGAERPSTVRLVLAGAAGLICIAIGVVASFFVPVLVHVAADIDPSAALHAAAYAVCTAAGGAAAWTVGSAIAHGRRRRPVAIAGQPAGA